MLIASWKSNKKFFEKIFFWLLRKANKAINIFDDKHSQTPLNHEFERDLIDILTEVLLNQHKNNVYDLTRLDFVIPCMSLLQETLPTLLVHMEKWNLTHKLSSNI